MNRLNGSKSGLEDDGKGEIDSINEIKEYNETSEHSVHNGSWEEIEVNIVREKNTQKDEDEQIGKNEAPGQARINESSEQQGHQEQEITLNHSCKHTEDDMEKDDTSLYGNVELKQSRETVNIINECTEEKNEKSSNKSSTYLEDDKRKKKKDMISITYNDNPIDKKLTYSVKGKKPKSGGEKMIPKFFGLDHLHNDMNKEEMNTSKHKKITKENLKLDMRDFFFTSQEKDVYEYVPETSNYAICHNDANELYKDVVTMNKHFLDEINVNIYSSPLDTYLSSMLAVSDGPKQRDTNSLFRKSSKNENNKNDLSDEKNKLKQCDILDENSINKPLYSYEFYKNKIFKHYHNNGLVIEIDPTKLKYNNSTHFEYDKNMSTYLNDPLSYLQKLKCEVEDITSYINDLANTKTEQFDQNNPNDKLNEDMIEHEQIVKQILHNREPPEVLMELFSLKNDIDNMLNDDALKKLLKSEKMEKKKPNQESIAPNGFSKDVKTILEQLQNWDDVNVKREEEEEEEEEEEKKKKQKDKGKDKKVNELINQRSGKGTHEDLFPKQLNIYTLNSRKEKEVQTSDLLILERKIANIEKVLGIDKMVMLPYDDMNHAIIDLYSKLSLLDSNKLESVKKKMQNLQSEFLNLKKFKKDLLNISKERGNYEESIDEIFKILDMWKKTHHIIPNVLARLYQLKKVHDNVQSFSSRLDDLEKQQMKLDETISLAEQNIKLINFKINENINFLQDTLKKMEFNVVPHNE
ncbi:dynactin subunit 2 [Plasmodium gonderi]|uniref:Dynactin subunit 2 n=1 Tax=Plasmodium gonderi TaxID=77519 RepID=A0A1Y1JKY4_PLAGO|nr:dynactin subunit 2 [Plasmodium gonderi]GAW82115.1 dynactin subunit 2 [Plasmodium gonderi]